MGSGYKGGLVGIGLAAAAVGTERANPWRRTCQESDNRPKKTSLLANRRPTSVKRKPNWRRSAKSRCAIWEVAKPAKPLSDNPPNVPQNRLICCPTAGRSGISDLAINVCGWRNSPFQVALSGCRRQRLSPLPVAKEQGGGANGPAEQFRPKA